LLDWEFLLRQWQRALKAERKSPGTIETYSHGVLAFLRWCRATGTEPVLTRTHAQDFVASLLDAGAQGATAHARLKGLRRFSAWLADEGELDTDPLAGMRLPKVDTKVVEALTDDQLKLLLKACAGKDLADRRDEALVRLMIDTGARAGEVVALGTADLDLDRGLVHIRRGKGGKGRIVPIGAATSVSLDRYLRLRRNHALAGTEALWLGQRGKSFGYAGLYDALRARAATAGIDGFHIHLLRHTFATRWKAAQGSDDGLMAIAGWSSRAMIDRYAGAAAAQRAADESRRLGLGEI
jgi:site-specific recombinase XerD